MKVKRHSILAHVALNLLTLVIWCTFGFHFLLCLSIPLSPKALCWKTSPKKLTVRLLNNKWWWKYLVSLGIKISPILLLDLILLLWKKFTYWIWNKFKAKNPFILFPEASGTQKSNIQETQWWPFSLGFTSKLTSIATEWCMFQTSINFKVNPVDHRE